MNGWKLERIYAQNMSSAEVNKNIRQCFTQRVSPAMQVPMELTEEEASQLLRIAPVNMILYAFTKFSNWLQRKKAEGKYISRENTLKALTTTVQNVKNDSGKAVWKQRKATEQTQAVVKPQPPAQHDPEEVLELRQEFQSVCTDGSWCITDEEAQELLSQHNMNTLRRVFSELGQTFSADHAQDALDLLAWKLSNAA